MATRINTKFVVTLVSVIVLLVLGLMFAFMFLKKSAADHVEIADEAMIRAVAAIEEGDVEVHNSELQRAAKHYGNAHAKDAGNAEYLYSFVDAHEKVICDNLTAAGNELDSIISGAASIQNMPGASDEDRQFLYEKLYDNLRMGFSGLSPVNSIRIFSDKRLDVSPQDPVALRYSAIARGYLAGQRTKDSEVAEDLEQLNAAVEANPNDPLLHTALSRYHLGNARRIYSTQGNTFSDDVDASFMLSLESIKKALELAKGDPDATVSAAAILSEIRSNKEDRREEISQLQYDVVTSLGEMLADKANRDKLYVDELATATNLIRRVLLAPDADPPRTFDGPAKALELAKLLTKDRPDQPRAYQVLGDLQRETNRLDEALTTFEKGVAAKRTTNAPKFILDNESRLNMNLLLVDLKSTMAVRSNDAEQRQAKLAEMSKQIDELAKVDTQNTAGRDARVSFLRGQIALFQNKPQLAVTRLEAANLAFENRDARTLRLLAQTHARLNNDALVAGYYETILNNNLRPTGDDLLNLINLYLNPSENQQIDRALSLLDTYDGVVPGDVRSIQLRARALQLQGKTTEAIAMLEDQDLAKYPQLLNLIATMQAATGNTKGVIEILRKRLANTPEGERMNMQLVSQLLNLIPDDDAKKAELNKLVSQGLEPAFAKIFERVLSSGQTSLEDELATIELIQEDPAQVALQKYLAYRRWNNEEEGRPFLAKAIELAPNDPSIMDWQYRIALVEERWSDAEQVIKEMLKLPANERPEAAVADGQFMRAQILVAQAGAMEEGDAQNKRVRDAIVAYNTALDQYSHYIDGWVQLARLHMSQNNDFAAIGPLEEALRRQSQNVTALELLALAQARSGDRANALENYQRVLTIQPNRTSALNQFTTLATQMGLASRAIRVREEISQRVPNNFDNRRAMALLYAQNKEIAAAKQAVQAVIQAQGRTRQNIATKSQVLILNNEQNAAMKEVQDYLASQGEDAQWQDHLLLAGVLEEADKTEQADASFTKAIELEKAEGTFVAAASFGQVKVNRGEIAEAAKMYEGLAAQYPENDALKQQAAQLYLQLQNYGKVETIAQGMPESLAKYQILVQSAASQNGKLGVAIERVRAAVELYPSDFGLRLNLVELLRNQEDIQDPEKRDYTDVLDKAKALAQRYPDRVDAKVAYADVLTRMNKMAEATAQLQAALAFAPRHFGSNERLFRIKIARAARIAANNQTQSREEAREALAIMSLLIEGRPNNPVLLRSAGQAAQLAGLPAQAVDYFRLAFEANATAESLATYANALIASNQGASARAVMEDPANATLVSNSLFMRALRGRAIAAAGQSDTAMTLFRNLLDQNQELSDRITVARQVTAAFASDPARAIELLESSLSKDLPVELESLIAGMLLSQREYEWASRRLLKYWDKPVSDVSTQITLLTQLALAQQESDQLTQSKATYERVYALMMENEGATVRAQRIQLLNNMAFLLADQIPGYEEDAVRYAKQAVSLMTDADPAEQVALIEDTLGWAYHKAGRNVEAIRMLKKSINRLPLSANQLHLGRVYLAMNDKDRALLVLESAIDQAKADEDKRMIEKTEKWYREAL